MTPQTENCPGVTPSQGTIRIAQVLSSGRGANSGLFLHPQGHRLVSAWCGQSGSVDFWGVDTGRHLQSFALDVELTDVGSQVGAELMPPGTDATPEHWPAHQLPVVDAHMNALGGNVALAAGRGARVFRFSPDEGELVPAQTLRGHEHAVVRVALDSSGERAITADSAGQIYVWDALAGRTQQMLRISTVPHTVGFIWNNMLAMCGDNTGRVICWELQHGRRHLQFQAHRGPLVRTAFNQDSGVLLTAGGDRAARMWNLEEGKQIGRDMNHRSPICDVAFAYAGRFVVTCGSDGHVAIWNSTDGDLLDWYFDSAPVYRIAFDRLNGTLVAGGARTIKVLNVDWQRLREVDANARSSGFMLEVSPADHAAMFAEPPRPQPTHNAVAGQEVPVGSVMTARQTTDLPFPDPSQLAVPRRGGPPSASVSAQPVPQRPNPGHPGQNVRPAFTSQAPPTMVPTPGPPTSNRTPTRPGAPAPGATRTQTFGGVGGQSLAEAMASAQQRQQEQQPARATAYGIGKAPASDATSFFGQVDPSPSSRMSSVDSDLIKAGQGGAPNAPAETVDALIERVDASRSRSQLSKLSEVAPAESKSGRLQGDELRKRLLTVALIVVLVMAGARMGVAWYFTNQGWPAAVAGRADEARDDFDEQVSIMQAEFAEYEEEEQANITSYRRSGSMSPESAERAIARVESRIEQRRSELDAEIGEAERDRDLRLGELELERRISAGRMANLSALGAGVITLLVALLVGLKPRDSKRHTR